MAAHGNNAPLIHHHDTVRLFDRRQTVCHHNGRTVPAQVIKCRLHQTLALGIQRRGRLIQQKHRGVAQDRTRNGDALLLPPRQHHAPLAHIGVIAFGQVHDEFMRGGGFGGSFDLCIRRVRATKADVVARGGGKDDRVLRHQRDMTTEGIAHQRCQRHTVQTHLARLRIVKPLNHLDNRGLARPRRADEGNRFTRLNGQVHLIQRRCIRPRRIGERDIIKRQLTAHRFRQGLRLHRVAHAIVGLQQLHQTLRCACGTLQLAPDFRERRDRACHHHRVDHKLHQGALAHGAKAHIIRPDPQHADNAGKHQKDHNHSEPRPRLDAPFGHLIRGLGHLREMLAAQILMGKGLHGLHRAQSLARIARRSGDPVLIFL